MGVVMAISMSMIIGRHGSGIVGNDGYGHEKK